MRFAFPLVLAAAVFAQPQPAPTNSPVVGILNYIHAVNNLDRTLAFYHQVFGLDGDPRPFPNPGVPALTNSPGVTLRLGTLRLPNAAFGMELTEFSAADRKPGQARRTDPGAAALILSVKDIDPIFAAIKQTNAPIITTSGAPVKLDPTDPSLRSILIRDPDGYIVQVVQTPPADGEPAVPGNVHSVAMGLTVGDMEANRKFYHGLLGFDLTGKLDFSTNPALLDLNGVLNGAPNGASGAKFQVVSSDVPGTKANMEFYEFQGVPRTPFHLRVTDPGAPALCLRVKDLDGLLARLRAAGTPVTSLNGAVVQFSPTIRNIFVTDPNGLNIELYEQTQ
jgi:catechol 2,3-dioxygenase-like lactoylglutathione lyase family enzyme